MKFEDRTYNVSVGPLYNEHVGLLKPGQLIDIKARAIPDADDQFVSRRIAQLQVDDPRPGCVLGAHAARPAAEGSPVRGRPETVGRGDRQAHGRVLVAHRVAGDDR